MTNSSFHIPDDLRVKFTRFVDVFVEVTGPGPKPETDNQAVKLTAAQRAELEMFERFLHEKQVPEWMTQRILPRYIQEELLRTPTPTTATWILRWASFTSLMTAILIWLSDLPRKDILLPLAILSAVFWFWRGEKRKD
jgi:hypothetical protein